MRCAVIHPDFTRTPLVRALGDEFVKRNVLPYLQSSRLNHPSEVASAVCDSIEAAHQSATSWSSSYSDSSNGPQRLHDYRGGLSEGRRIELSEFTGAW